jgi:type I restriction enzyme S subunit
MNSEIEFYREKEFKDTEIGRIPQEWKIRKLGDDDIALEIYRYPTYYNVEYVSNGVPEIRGELIRENGELETDLTKYRYISYETSKRFPRTILKEGDFVISVRGTMGKIAVVPKLLEGSNITANLMRISLNPSNCYPGFFKQVFLSQKFQKVLNLLSPQTTIKTIQAPRLKSIKLPLPPLQEQKAIAKVLNNFDNLIETINKQIKTFERIKKGLTKKYLTEGIFEHKEFKDTEIGRIPKEWEVVRLGDVLTLKNGERPSFADNGTVPIYGANGIMGFSSKFLVDNDFTIVIGRVGASGEIHLGRRKIWISDNAIYSEKYDNTKLYMPFIYYALKLTELSRFASKTTHPIITQSFLNRFLISLPPRKEQKAIADRLKSVGALIETKQEEKKHLERAKNKVMELLLSGKVRIKLKEGGLNYAC